MPETDSPARRAQRRYLFVLWNGGGNVAPQLSLARRLVDRGHGVRVLTEECLAADVVSAGCRFEPFARAPNRADRSEDLIRDWEARTPVGAFARARDRLVMGPAAAYAHDTLAALEREPVDALVSDYMLFGVAVAGERAAVPTAAIVHHIYIVPEPGKPAPGPGFQPSDRLLSRTRDWLVSHAFIFLFNRGLPAVNRARDELGLGPLRSVVDQLDHVDRVLVLTSQSFDFVGRDRPPHVRYVGPVPCDPEWVEPWRSPWQEDDERPLIIVSFSSTYMRQERPFARTVQGLSRLDARVLVTTGPAIDPLSVRASRNAVVVRSAPHAQLFGQAAVVVSHAGMGTVTRALTSGVPLVCIPMGRDQLDIAARVVYAGAGLRVRPSSRPGAIRRAVERVLQDPGFRAAAGRVGSQMLADAESGRAVAELEALAGAETG